VINVNISEESSGPINGCHIIVLYSNEQYQHIEPC